MELKSATENLSIGSGFSDTLQKEETVERLDQQNETVLRNTYLFEVSDFSISEEEHSCGRCSKATVRIDLSLSEAGRIIKNNSVKSAAKKLIDKGYHYNDGELGAQAVRELKKDLVLPKYNKQVGGDYVVNIKPLNKYGESGFAVSVSMDLEMSEDPLMGYFELGRNTLSVRLVETLDDPGDLVLQAEMNSSESIVAVSSNSSDGNIYFYSISDFGSGATPIETISDASDSVDDMGFDPNGNYFAFCDAQIYIYNESDIGSGATAIETFDDTHSNGAPSQIKFDPDQRWFLVGGAGGWTDEDDVHVYDYGDIGTGSISRVGLLTEPQNSVQSFAFSPDGSDLAVGEKNGGVFVYDASTLDSSPSATYSKDALGSFKMWDGTFLSDGSKYLVGDEDNNVHVLDPNNSYNEIDTLTEPGGSRHLALNSDESYLAVFSDDNNTYVYNVADLGSGATAVDTLTDGSDSMRRGDWTSDGEHLVAPCRDNNVYVYKVADLGTTPSPEYTLTDPSGECRSIAMTSSGVSEYFVVPSGDTNAYVYNRYTPFASITVTSPGDNTSQTKPLGDSKDPGYEFSVDTSDSSTVNLYENGTKVDSFSHDGSGSITYTSSQQNSAGVYDWYVEVVRDSDSEYVVSDTYTYTLKSSISGQIYDDNGLALENADILLVDKTNTVVVDTSVSDASGNYTVVVDPSQDDVNAEYHVAASYEDGSNTYNYYSYPFYVE